MFAQPCFIRKNTPELRKKLEDLGYVNVSKIRYFDKSIYTYCGYKICFVSPYKIKKVYNNFIDCGTNEDLFLAIAALRDDSDYMQWFTDGEKWFQNKQNDIEVIHYGAGNPINFYKASVEEIIEHFKE